MIVIYLICLVLRFILTTLLYSSITPSCRIVESFDLDSYLFIIDHFWCHANLPNTVLKVIECVSEVPLLRQQDKLLRPHNRSFLFST